jgi:hypothetical protein
MKTEPRPCSSVEAVARALSIVGKGGQYVLGTGDYRPRVVQGQLIDTPWTEHDSGMVGCDCAGFAISWCYKLRRHRPGYNSGPWATVTDDMNNNSVLEDAEHTQDLAEIVTTPAPGVLLIYPTITLPDHPGMRWIGHVGIVTSVRRCSEWDNATPDYSLLDVAQCMGPNGRRPGVVSTDGAIWSHHDSLWGKPEHRTRMARMLP